MECAPQWIVDKAVNTELEANWKGSYEEKRKEEVSRKENVIRANFVYKLKEGEKGLKRVKSRLCLHGNFY